MRFGKIIAISMVSILGSMPVFGQTLDTVTGPAELQPLDFKGDQFVDSTGCVFIRAGFDGRDRWVPRVLRSKKLVCGFKPSFDKSQTRSLAQARTGAGTPVVLTLDDAPVAQPTAPAPTIVPTADIVENVVTRPDDVILPTGPELVRPGTGVARVPKGYLPAWQDDRLNPKRGIPTVAGIAASDLRWTRTVPRKLIQQSTGLDVTLEFSKLIYPFTDMKQQDRFMAAKDSYVLVVQPDGSILMKPKSG